MATKALHDLGASRNGLRRGRCEDIIIGGCTEMIAELENQIGESLDLNSLTSACIGKILMKFLFNTECEINDKEMLEELKRVEEGFFAMKWFQLFKYLPFLKIFGRKHVNRIAENHEKSKKYFTSILKEFKESSEECENSILGAYKSANQKNKIKSDGKF